MRCPVTGAGDHPVSWRCYALVPVCWLSEHLPYPVGRRFFPLIMWLDRLTDNPQNH